MVGGGGTSTLPERGPSALTKRATCWNFFYLISLRITVIGIDRKFSNPVIHGESFCEDSFSYHLWFRLTISAYYMVGSLAITALSLIVTVLVLNIFYHDPSKRISALLRVLVGDENKVEGAIQIEEKVTEKEAEMNNIEKNKSEWEEAANTIDRICLVLSLLGTIALLLFLTIGINLGD